MGNSVPHQLQHADLQATRVHIARCCADERGVACRRPIARPTGTAVLCRAAHARPYLVLVLAHVLCRHAGGSSRHL